MSRAEDGSGLFFACADTEGGKTMQDTVLQFFDRQMDAPCSDFGSFTD
ncbi:hypothetical protein [Claveliimonas bilis]|nr:hypothetical protein [Claveliimonas bilis]